MSPHLRSQFGTWQQTGLAQQMMPCLHSKGRDALALKRDGSDPIVEGMRVLEMYGWNVAWLSV